jgi:Raf kinase inhibitor-like YbhB/YbcL family protein
VVRESAFRGSIAKRYRCMHPSFLNGAHHAIDDFFGRHFMHINDVGGRLDASERGILHDQGRRPESWTLFERAGVRGLWLSRQQCFATHFMGSCPTRHEKHRRDGFDPDAPTGGLGWTHWEIANIPPSALSLEKGASGNPKLLPAGAVETLTDFGESRYGGPCPPQGGAHRYVVTASALNVAQLDVAPAASPAVVAYQMHGKVVAQAKYVAKYHRALTAD